MKQFLTEAITRLRDPRVPKFFRIIQAIGVSVATAGTTLATLPFANNTLHAIGTHIAVAGGVSVLVAQFACSNLQTIFNEKDTDNSNDAGKLQHSSQE